MATKNKMPTTEETLEALASSEASITQTLITDDGRKFMLQLRFKDRY
jgi:hypothetical protein